MDRRGHQRCPICQGPAKVEDLQQGALRCRTSICIQNHLKVACPRCSKSDLASVSFADGRWHYVCRECTNQWVKAASS